MAAGRPRVGGPLLSTRALNRALLPRQQLLERAIGSIESAVERIAGLQTQVSRSGYIGLWSRLDGVTREAYTAALNDRRLVQGWLMRVTIHTVSAADYWPMAIAVRSARRRWWLRTWGKGRTDDDMRRVAATLTALLAEGPLRLKELRARAVARGVPVDLVNPAALWVDLVRVPPQGTWERPRADNYWLASAWVDPVEIDETDAQRQLVRRYLAAFGPAAIGDVSSFTGLPVAGLRPLLSRMELRRFRDASGRELLDVRDGLRPDARSPAPVRFIGSFDPILLVQARRTQVLPDELRPIVFSTRTPQSWNTFLVDGQVAGTWTYGETGVELEPLRDLTSDERRAVEDEAHRVEGFIGA